MQLAKHTYIELDGGRQAGRQAGKERGRMEDGSKGRVGREGASGGSEEAMM